METLNIIAGIVVLIVLALFARTIFLKLNEVLENKKLITKGARNSFER